MTQQAKFTVSERDREYFRKIGRWKAESHAAALRAHLELPIAERLERSLAWTIAERPTWRWPITADSPAPMWERARKLGLLLEQKS